METVEAPPPAPLTLEQRLKAEDLTVLELSPADSSGIVQARQTQTQPTFTPVPVRATGGKVAARIATKKGTEVLVLEKLSVQLADVPLLSTGLTLTNLELKMVPVEPAPVTWAANQWQASAGFRVTMSISGWVRGENGASSPFETQVFEEVPLELKLSLDATAGLVAQFKSHGESSPSWHWVDMLETGAARFEGVAIEKQASASAF